MSDQNQIIKSEKPVSGLFSEVALLIEQARNKISTAVNSALVMLYWNIGRVVKNGIVLEKRAEYGQEIIKALSDKLISAYGKGYSYANLTRMIKFYEILPDAEILATLSQQLSWSHFVEFIKIGDSLKRDFYIAMCLNEHWSVRVLNERINSMLFERTAISKKPELTIVGDLEKLRTEKKMSVDLFLKDPYVLDFLGLADSYSETDLEQAILSELQKFILEMGNDFAFMARQKRIIIDSEDYYIDLLFFHRKLRRLVAIELKLGKFKHQYKSQVELYLKWLAKYEKQEDENMPIGLILCAEKSDEVIELLELDKSGIHVAEYLTELPPKEVFRQKLHESVEKAKRLIQYKQQKKD